jgi:multiple sugar transport system permease protein
MGVGMALVLHQNIWFRSLARSLILFPYFISTVVAVLVWKWLFNDLYGIMNHLPDHAGHDRLSRSTIWAPCPTR